MSYGNNDDTTFVEIAGERLVKFFSSVVKFCKNVGIRLKENLNFIAEAFPHNLNSPLGIIQITLIAAFTVVGLSFYLLIMLSSSILLPRSLLHGLSSRINRVFRSNLNDLVGKILSLLEFEPREPGELRMTDYYNYKEVQEILSDGLKQREQYLQLLYFIKKSGGRKIFRYVEFDDRQVEDMLYEIGVPPAFFPAILESWVQKQKRQEKLLSNYKAYLAFIAFMLPLNIIINRSVSWVIYPALAWGFGLAILTVFARDEQKNEQINLRKRLREIQRKSIPITDLYANRSVTPWEQFNALIKENPYEAISEVSSLINLSNRILRDLHYNPNDPETAASIYDDLIQIGSIYSDDINMDDFDVVYPKLEGICSVYLRLAGSSYYLPLPYAVSMALEYFKFLSRESQSLQERGSTPRVTALWENFDQVMVQLKLINDPDLNMFVISPIKDTRSSQS